MQTLLYEDYKQFILAMYEAKRANGTLSPLLKDPTSASIRNECVVVYKQGIERRDAGCLRAFFRTVPEGPGFLRIIERYPRDRFTPLLNFLRNPKIETDKTNLELLAWLIGFTPRPYEVGMRVDYEEIKSSIEKERLYKASSSTTAPTANADEEGERTREEITHGNGKQPPGKWMKYGLFGLGLLSAVFLGYVFLSGQGGVSQKDGGCMFWSSDHYVSIPCQTMGDTLVVPLDSLRLASFRKVTRPDTITRYSIGKLWYILIDGGIEIYTMGGRHPVERKKKLRPVSNTIYENRIVPLKASPPVN